VNQSLNTGSGNNHWRRIICQTRAKYFLSWSPTLAPDNYVPQTWGCWLSTVHPAVSETSFAAAATRVLNSSPSGLWKADLSYSQFRRSLKTARPRRIVNSI